MEVKIGIPSIPREIVIDTKSPRDEVEAALSSAVAEGGIFALADDRGGKILVPADKIAYVEFAGGEQRRVGFGSL